MPEASPSNPQPNPTPPPQKPKRNWKKILLFLLIGLFLISLVGVGLYLLIPRLTEEPASPNQKQATSSAKPKEVKKERTKAAYVDSRNIWVLDVVTKKELQITKDKSDGKISNKIPIFIDEDSFTYLKCTEQNCELWLVDLIDNKFNTKQIKKFNTPISTYDVDSKLKRIVYHEDLFSEKSKLHIFDLQSSKDKVVYEKVPLGRGISQNDAFYVDISPDGSKFFLIDTFLGNDIKIFGGKLGGIKLAATGFEDSTQPKIIVWALNGKRLASLSGRVTEPVWTLDSKSIIYRDTKKGLFTYDITNKKSEKLSGKTDWSNINISPDGKKLSHNKGFNFAECCLSRSSVYVFDLQSKKDKIVGDSLVSPAWVNSSYLITNKLRKCRPEDVPKTCRILKLEGEQRYTTMHVLVVVDVDSGKVFEVKTKSIPSF